jgi:hypothetical protein
MQRFVLFAMLAMAVGGYAEAALDSPPSIVVLNRIQSFVADQRRADAATCAAGGVAKPRIEVCIRDLAAKRRARIEGQAASDRPAAPAGTDI